jgi:hypothetical protein
MGQNLPLARCAAGRNEISPRRVERGRWTGVETDVFQGQGGASRLVGWADFSVVDTAARTAQPRGPGVC